MDVNISSEVAKMKRDLLKLIGVGEFSDTAAWKDPCTSFVIPEVFVAFIKFLMCSVGLEKSICTSFEKQLIVDSSDCHGCDVLLMHGLILFNGFRQCICTQVVFIVLMCTK